MEGWLQFFFATGGLLFFALLLWVGEQFDRRRWKREREAEEAARRAAE